MDPLPLRPLPPASALSSELSDTELVARIRAGEPQLFELVMRRHNARLYRAVRSLLRDESEAEDAMQDAYVRAFTHLHTFRAEARLSTWLTRIAINEALMRLRRRLPQVDLTLENDPQQPEESPAMHASDTSRPSPEDAAQARELRELLEGAVDTLPPGCRTAFVLRDVEGMSTAEAAESLGVSEESVRTRLHRARALLREALYARAGAAAGELFAFHASRCDRVVAAVLRRIA
ncbi:RNA polymerase sigma factor [Aggregicoccus sp. 17bor-14]|uniref:RNA polymerase sigma factor n=1 Tax=Myxococcaceae TaxID=31 RepID=UPI00129CFEB2|nr:MULTISPECIES: RNA polymerase sigma factor [Myxococcaceae]MBF5041823.1 RNA polymerase sigma factor [Simulacricoccus sp. 17bor-14]MRI87604.1 RNA polymerase sigma factor [Aggregicoccus sp. 17bor-14]